MKILSNKLCCAVAGGRSGSEKEDNQAAATPLKDPTYTPATSTTQSALREPTGSQYSITPHINANNIGGSISGSVGADAKYRQEGSSFTQGVAAAVDTRGNASVVGSLTYHF